MPAVLELSVNYQRNLFLVLEELILRIMRRLIEFVNLELIFSERAVFILLV